MSNVFSFRSGRYFCDAVAVADIAQSVGTPCYIYSKQFFVDRCDALSRAFSDHPTTFCYAVKANSNLAVLRTIAGSGFGADVVSLGELARTKIAGFASDQIVFSGVGKQEAEIVAGLDAGLLSFNVESIAELVQLCALAKSSGKVAPVSLRVNPNVDAKTHKKIATGLYSTKFGIPESDIPEALAILRATPQARLRGLACHIGSQMVDLAPLSQAAERMMTLTQNLRAAGLQPELLNLGGGIGIDYGGGEDLDAAAYARAVLPYIAGSSLRLVLEPGRFVVGNGGILLTRVLHVKQNPQRRFVIVDAAMTELLRPTLYGAEHAIFSASEREIIWRKVDVVGPVCETGDYLRLDCELAEVAAGDLLVVRSCGAYAASMASNYNTRPLAAEILVDGGGYVIVRKRQALESLWQDEVLC